jgi:hypothetical protein
LLYCDVRQNVAVLIEKKSKKIIDVGFFKDDISKLNEVAHENDKDKEDKNKDPKKPEDDGKNLPPLSPDKKDDNNDNKNKIIVDSSGNAIPLKPGETIESSPDGKMWQIKDSNGKPTGDRFDGKGYPKQSDPNLMLIELMKTEALSLLLVLLLICWLLLVLLILLLRQLLLILLILLILLLIY